MEWGGEGWECLGSVWGEMGGKGMCEDEWAISNLHMVSMRYERGCN